VFSLTEWP